jgi:Subunit CCDC53 of WASH complex
MSQPPDRVDPADPTNPFDPFGLWKQYQQTMLETWSKTMTDAVHTSAYAETTGRMLDSYLTVSAPLRKVIDQTMTQLLNQLSLPSRAEVVSLAERLTNIELRLDDLDARLDGIQRGVEQTASAVAALRALTTTIFSASASASAASRTRASGRTPEREQSSETSAPARTTQRAARGATTQPRSGTRSKSGSKIK